MERLNEQLYAAFQAKDTRFDGRFFVGISSTGIYCRPVCRAKRPKAENCTFYATAAEAEQAGYRPCLLCRPELAPGTTVADDSAMLAHRAARMLEEKCGGGQSLDVIAARLGCTGRHLRRVFMAEYHVTPVKYLQTCRLLLAKNLLTDTGLPVLEVAMTAGFGSLRRFNDLFQAHYRLTPTALRKQGRKNEQKSGQITLALGYRPPYRWEEMLRFLAGRAITGVEAVDKNRYKRTVRLQTADNKPVFGWIQVGHNSKKHVLTVKTSEELLPVLPQVLSRIKQLFDLYCEPGIVYDSLQSMNEICPGYCTLGTRLPGCFDAFEMSVRAVLGQQISVKAAGTLAARLAKAYGLPLETGEKGLDTVFPSPCEILALGENIADHLGPLGITAARANTIYELAKTFAEDKIGFMHCSHPQKEMEKLMQIKGIGKWTAQYIAMRAMGWPDAFLETDAGIKKALAPRTAKEMLQMAEAWRPWRSYATINLWNTL